MCSGDFHFFFTDESRLFPSHGTNESEQRLSFKNEWGRDQLCASLWSGGARGAPRPLSLPTGSSAPLLFLARSSPPL